MILFPNCLLGLTPLYRILNFSKDVYHVIDQAAAAANDAKDKANEASDNNNRNNNKIIKMIYHKIYSNLLLFERLGCSQLYGLRKLLRIPHVSFNVFM